MPPGWSVCRPRRGRYRRTEIREVVGGDLLRKPVDEDQRRRFRARSTADWSGSKISRRGQVFILSPCSRPDVEQSAASVAEPDGPTRTAAESSSCSDQCLPDTAFEGVAEVRAPWSPTASRSVRRAARRRPRLARAPVRPRPATAPACSTSPWTGLVHPDDRRRGPAVEIADDDDDDDLLFRATVVPRSLGTNADPSVRTGQVRR